MKKKYTTSFLTFIALSAFGQQSVLEISSLPEAGTVINQAYDNQIDPTRKPKNIEASKSKFLIKGTADTSKTSLDLRTSIPANLDNFQFIPNIKAGLSANVNNLGKTPLGAKHFVGLFFGQLTTDTLSKNFSFNLLVPELSKYGFVYEGTGFTPLKNPLKIIRKGYDTVLFLGGWNFQAGLLGKALPVMVKDTSATDSIKLTNKFNTTLIAHVRMGLEFVLLPKVLSVYGNINILSPLTENKNFEKLYPHAKPVNLYWDLGVKALLAPTEKGGLSIDIGMILLKPLDARAFYESDDIVIPTIRLGYLYTLSN